MEILYNLTTSFSFSQIIFCNDLQIHVVQCCWDISDYLSFISSQEKEDFAMWLKA